MRGLFWALGLVTLTACSQSQTAEPAADLATPAAASASSATAEADAAHPGGELADHEAFGYFAGGCFWGVEHYLEQMDGVLAVESGYMGGDADAPTYETVSAHDTDHLETVRVRYDTEKIAYREIAKRFFEIHDPTQADGQGPDIGEQYKSAVFYADAQQRADAEELIGLLKAKGYDVVTDVAAAKTFWKAEDYHQDYYSRTGKTPYCHVRIKRFDP